MNTERLEFSIPIDDDGYAEYQCPFCEEKFRLMYSEFNDESIIEMHCPSCGLSDVPEKFLTNEMVEHINAKLQNMLIENVNRSFSKLNFKSKNMQVTTKKISKVSEKSVFLKDTNFDVIEFRCCSKKVKVLSVFGNTKCYCPYCGARQ